MFNRSSMAVLSRLLWGVALTQVQAKPINEKDPETKTWLVYHLHSLKEGEAAQADPLLLQRKNGVWFDAPCLKKVKEGKTCLAYSHFKRDLGPYNKVKETPPGEGNPSASACAAFKGDPISVRDEGGDTLSLCLFKDSSMVSSWSLKMGKAPNKVGL